jgi:hypothetical protein
MLSGTKTQARTKSADDRGAYRSRDRKLPNVQLRAFRRANEVIRLICGRYREHGELPSTDIERGIWWLIADALSARYKTDLNLPTVMQYVYDRSEGQEDWIDEEVALDQIKHVCRAIQSKSAVFTLTTDERAGRALELTAAERRQYGLTTMYAINESRAQVQLRRRLAKNIEERRRMAKKRLDAGVKPHVTSSTRTRPWEAFGISRRTWERRGRPDPKTLKRVENIVQLDDRRN